MQFSEVEILQNVKKYIKQAMDIGSEMAQCVTSWKELKEELNGYVSNLKIEDETERLKVAKILYWTTKLSWSGSPPKGIFLHKQSISNFTGINVSNLHSELGNVVASLKCSQCKNLCDTQITSMTKYEEEKKLCNKGLWICHSCSQINRAEFQYRNEERENQSLELIKELRSLPYKEYLKTDHWQKIRKQSLRRVGYKCQICNEGNKVLNVHHRTYQNLGNELWTDIIVLCGGCHSIFHKNGKLTPMIKGA